MELIWITGGAWQGKTDYARANYGEEWEIRPHYEQTVRRQLLEGKDPMEEARKLLEGEGRLVLIGDEIGCGIVPADPFERAYREANGRVACFLAGEAKQVIRVVCGIGSRLK